MIALGALTVSQIFTLNSVPIIPYEIHASMQSDGRRAIASAIGEYETKTCIRFRQTSTGDRILFRSDCEGCWSYIGNNRNGAQDVCLAPGYFWVEIIKKPMWRV